MATTVHVQNISSQTSEKEVRDFFSFCGKISSLSVTPTSDAPDASKSATVTFEKETAAKTALLLDNTQLGPAQVNVTAAQSISDMAGGKATAGDDEQDVAPEDKPRTRIIAEYLAHGYVVSDKAIQGAIDLDKKHGISSRFQSALTNFDAKYKASDRVKAADTQYKVSERASGAWSGLNSYFEKALDTPTGQRVRQFYMDSNKQIMDVHNEARHLADLKTGKPATGQTEDHSEAAPSQAEEMGMEKLPDSDRTKCNCGATTEKCPCEPGKCACASCAKNPDGTPVTTS
ncbi:hypothetical protein NA57DRAFT_41306 [Rhizodiscina lignyota]|uniref:RRM domain-containing protein n=1 Tax=Rhizodiscina lignyota TaxID=1504668 RepID=A0A9P4IG60_9PEZI|nr:hypothetical protein NA57DRAFT_41306 [Rhizodiscina lignyota]